MENSWKPNPLTGSELPARNSITDAAKVLLSYSVPASGGAPGGDVLTDVWVAPFYDPEADNKQSPRQNVRLTKACKKRVARLVNTGYSREVAIKIALANPNPALATPGPALASPGPNPKFHDKRSQWEGNTPPQTAPQEKMARREVPGPVSHCDAAVGVKVGVMHSSFPGVLLSTDQLIQVQDGLMRLVEEGAHNAAEVCPSYTNCAFKPGYMVLTCCDQKTASWTIAVIGDCKPWDGASLKAMNEKDIPKPQILSGYFPNSKDTDTARIMKRLDVQNGGLNVDRWRVLSRKDLVKAVHLTLSVDQQSVDALRARKFRVNFSFGSVELRLKSSKPAAEAAAEEGVADRGDPGLSGVDRLFDQIKEEDRDAHPDWPGVVASNPDNCGLGEASAYWGQSDSRQCSSSSLGRQDGSSRSRGRSRSRSHGRSRGKSRCRSRSRSRGKSYGRSRNKSRSRSRDRSRRSDLKEILPTQVRAWSWTERYR